MKTTIKSVLSALAVAAFAVSTVGAAGANPGKEDILHPAHQSAKPGLRKLMNAPAKPVIDASWHSGISETSASPFRQYAVINQFHGLVAGSHIDVYAGSFRNNPSQGVFVVTVSPMDGSAPQTRQFLTAPRAGAAKIVANNLNGTIKIATQNGGVFTYALPHVGANTPVWQKANRARMGSTCIGCG